MTFRLRPRTRRARRGLFEAEDRRDFLVNVLFAGLIALSALGLLIAIGLAYYDNNLRPLANVGGVEISPALVRDRLAFNTERIDRDEGRLRELQINNEITLGTLSTKTDELESKKQQMTADSISEELIDLIYQSQLAAGEGITPTNDEITAAVDKEFSTPEKRHIQLISVKPEKDSATAQPTVAQKDAAIAEARQALAELQAGADWAAVAAKYSDDPGASTGGDGGTISANNPTDAGWVRAIFALEQGGTTGIVGLLGCARPDVGDCEYRIGRVVEITPGHADTAYQDKLTAKVGADSVRRIVGWELAAQRLRDKITAAATTGAVDQVHLGEIIIRDTEVDPQESPDPVAAQGEIRYAQILVVPGDDPDGAADIPATDPRWAEAENEAKGYVEELNAITDATARAERFAALATEKSDDDASKADGGEMEFTSRDLLPTEVAKSLFDTTHADGDVLGPVKEENGFYILLFHERRGTPQERLAQLKADIAAGVDWNVLVEKYSDADEEDLANGGDIGWFSRDMLSQVEEETAQKLFALQAGQVSEPIAFGTDSLTFKAFDHTSRELDPNQLIQLTDPDFGVFANWYSDKKTEAENARVIRRAGEPDVLPTEEPSPSPEPSATS